MEFLKISLLMQLKMVSGILFIKTLLRKIYLEKILFIQEIEMEQEVFIPYTLSQDHLPLSMRFYDPILHIVDLEISDDKKEFFYSTNQKMLEKFRKTNFKQILKDRFFGSEKGNKMTFKHAIVNQKEFNQINHHQS